MYFMIRIIVNKDTYRQGSELKNSSEVMWLLSMICLKNETHVSVISLPLRQIAEF